MDISIVKTKGMCKKRFPYTIIYYKDGSTHKLPVGKFLNIDIMISKLQFESNKLELEDI